MLPRPGPLFGMLPGDVAIDVDGPALEITDREAILGNRLRGRLASKPVLGQAPQSEQTEKKA